MNIVKAIAEEYNLNKEDLIRMRDELQENVQKMELENKSYTDWIRTNNNDINKSIETINELNDIINKE